MSDLVLLLAALAVAAVAWYAWRRARGASSYDARGYLLRYSDIDGWVVIPARLDAAGLVADGVTYPVPVRLTVAGVTLWIILVDAPALVDHVALERARESAALSSLWAGGGQWLDFLRVLGVLLPAALTVVVWRQVTDIAAQIALLISLVAER